MGFQHSSHKAKDIFTASFEAVIKNLLSVLLSSCRYFFVLYLRL